MSFLICLPLKTNKKSSKLIILDPSLSTNLEIKDTFIFNLHEDKELKKSVPLIRFVSSKEGWLLKFLSKVVIVLAPFSKSFYLYFDITIYKYYSLLNNCYLPSKYLLKYNDISAILF